MTPYHDDPFLFNAHCGEHTSNDLDDCEEVNRQTAEESDFWQGYDEWSRSIDSTKDFGEAIGTCELCGKPIHKSQALNYHHPIPRSENGQITIAVHQVCHVEEHRVKGDWIRWGRAGGLKSSSISRHWVNNLLHVRDNPRPYFDPHFQ